ncbi:MAG: hypothetical protein R3F46_12770 [bacterium]
MAGKAFPKADGHGWTGGCCQKSDRLQFHAYRSITYRRQKNILPSQQYTFHMAAAGYPNGKLIIVTRLRKEWEAAVPELVDYSCIELANARSPYLTPTNLRVWGADGKAGFITSRGQAELNLRQNEIWQQIVSAVSL